MISCPQYHSCYLRASETISKYADVDTSLLRHDDVWCGCDVTMQRGGRAKEGARHWGGRERQRVGDKVAFLSPILCCLRLTPKVLNEQLNALEP